MNQTDLNQWISKLALQRNKAEAERNLLNTLILDKIREVEALKKENTDLREALHMERNTMGVTEYKVVGVHSAAWDVYTDISAWDTLEKASVQAKAIILNDCVIENKQYSRIEVVKITEERVDI